MRNLPFKIMRAYSTAWMRTKARVVVKGLDELPLRGKGEKRVYLLLEPNHDLRHRGPACTSPRNLSPS